MTVRELIEELKKLNPDLPVYVSDCCYGDFDEPEVYPHEDRVMIR